MKIKVIKGKAKSKEDITCIPNCLFGDTRLSLEARGLFSSILSRSPRMDLSLESNLELLADCGSESKDTISKYANELEKYEYLVRLKKDDGSEGLFIREDLIYETTEEDVEEYNKSGDYEIDVPDCPDLETFLCGGHKMN